MNTIHNRETANLSMGMTLSQISTLLESLSGNVQTKFNSIDVHKVDAPNHDILAAHIQKEQLIVRALNVFTGCARTADQKALKPFAKHAIYFS